MRRISFVIVLLGLVVLGIGFLALGAFPPTPRSEDIQRVLPNDRFRGG